VRDANNGALISSAVYSRVIVAAPYRFKLWFSWISNWFCGFTEEKTEVGNDRL
jgi:hypothetical protein